MAGKQVFRVFLKDRDAGIEFVADTCDETPIFPPQGEMAGSPPPVMKFLADGQEVARFTYMDVVAVLRFQPSEGAGDPPKERSAPRRRSFKADLAAARAKAGGEG